MYREQIECLSFDQRFQMELLLDLLKTDYQEDIRLERLISDEVQLMKK